MKHKSVDTEDHVNMWYGTTKNFHIGVTNVAHDGSCKTLNLLNIKAYWEVFNDDDFRGVPLVVEVRLLFCHSASNGPRG